VLHNGNIAVFTCSPA